MINTHFHFRPLIIVIIACCFINCRKSDFSVIGPYVDTAAIYGVLHADTPVQVIRINRSFLVQGNALQYAKIPDSINYGKELKVWLERWKDNSRTDSFPLNDSLITTAPSGNFSNQQEIYITRHKIYTDSEYRLYAFNTKSRTLFSGTTKIIGNFNLITTEASFYEASGESKKVSITFHPDPNYLAVQYQVVIRFSYKEMIGSSEVNKSWDYIRLVNPNSVYDLSTEPEDGEQILNVLANYVRTHGPLNTKRYFNNIQIMVTGYNDILNNYMQFENYSGYTPDKNSYSNIKNGSGIIASKYIASSLPGGMDSYSYHQFIKLYPDLGF